MDPSKIRSKIRRFRILIIGRANAGKTTILQRVCNTGEKPAIYNRAGQQIEPAVLNASRERGEHDIENEMVFKSNPGFVFHDSRGFEAGGESEFDKVKDFITRRSKEPRLGNRLHAIWYCIPMDQECRSFTAGENKFFSQCDTGTIPVIVLFTKFDALYDDRYMELTSQGVPGKTASAQAMRQANESFANGPQLKILKDLQPPKYHVCLHDMNKDGADCGPLIQSTTGSLDNDVLQQLFISTQQTNLELCMEHALRRILPDLVHNAQATEAWHKLIIARSGVWFPHIWMREELLLRLFLRLEEREERRRELLEGRFRDLDERLDFEGRRDDDVSLSIVLRARAVLIQVLGHCSQLDVSLSIVLRARAVLIQVLGHCSQLLLLRLELSHSHCADMQSRLLCVASGLSPLENNVQLISAAVIIFEHSFYIHDKQRYLQDKTNSVPSFLVALEQYIASPHAAAVKTGVNAAVQAYEKAVTIPAPTYEEAVTTVTRAYEEAVATASRAYEEAVKGKRSTWMAKSPFEPLKRKVHKAFRRSKGKKKEASKEETEASKEETEASKEETEVLCSQVKAGLMKTVLEITLNHRLPKP